MFSYGFFLQGMSKVVTVWRKVNKEDMKLQTDIGFDQDTVPQTVIKMDSTIKLHWITSASSTDMPPHINILVAF